MAVIYLIFNEGYTATDGEEWMRPDLADEAIRLARMLAVLAPDEPEVLGLQALLEIQGSRMPARLDEDGTGTAGGAGPDPLGSGAASGVAWRHWRSAELARGRGRRSGGISCRPPIAAQHARAKRAEDTDWRRIAGLYDVLGRPHPGRSSR